MPFAAQSAIVHPTRMPGANAAFARFRRSHLALSPVGAGAALLLLEEGAELAAEVAGVEGRERLRRYERMATRLRARCALQEPGVFEHDPNRSFTLHVLFTVST
jgi:hypothetical protein